MGVDDARLTDPRGLQIVDPVLTNLALAYRAKDFIYDQLGSSMDVATNAGQYPIWSQEDFLRDDVESEVDQRAETPEIDASYSLGSYLLHNYRLKTSITPEERAQAHPALRLEQQKNNLLLDRMALRRERRLAARLRKTTNGGQLTLGGGVSTKWDASSGTTILKDLKAARKASYDVTGQQLDTVIMGWEVAYAISLSAEILDLVKYTKDGDMIISQGERLLPREIQGLKIVVAGSDKYNAAKRGAAASLQSIWSDNVRLIKDVANNAWGEPATFYKLRGQVLPTQEGATNRSPSAGGGFALVDKWATADPPVDYTRAWEKVDEKVTAPDVGYEIADVLT